MLGIRYIIWVVFLWISNIAVSQESNTKNNKILFVVSNQHTYGTTEMNTSNHFAEIVVAYDVFVGSGYKVDFVSPEGGAVPIGYIKTSDSIQKKYIYDAAFMKLLKKTFRPEDIQASNYKAVYYSGGGAAMFGVPENKMIQNISTQIYQNNGIISAICHGTAGIVNLKMKDGTYLYQGKQVNGYPDIFENKEKAYYKTFPFSIEETINKNGGNFMYSKKGWDKHFIIDGRLITGQDPTASASVALEVVKMLKKNDL